MEVVKPHVSDKMLNHRPLSPFRFLRGLVCLVVFLTSSLMFLVYFGPLVAVVPRIFSIHHSRKATSFVFGLWLALWPYLFEKINGTKMVFSGDHVPATERIIIIANHRTEVDWMFLWDLAIRKGCLGYIKYVLKSSLMKLPILGWGFHILEFISVDRKWETDEPIIRQKLSSFVDPQDPLWLAIFPEGTDFTEQKCKMSQIYAAEVGLPVFKNVLIPKTRGFCACLESLRASLDAVYDVTIAYKQNCPTFLDIVFGVDPSEVHIHVRRVPFNKIPLSNDEAAAWLMEAFKTKDELLSHFSTHGQFPDDAIEGELSTLKCCVNIVLVVFLTAMFSYLTFSFIWFKVYTGLACAYLASATYLNIQPLPILGFLIPTFCNKRTKK